MHKEFFKRPLTYSPGTRTLTIVTIEEDFQKKITIYGLGHQIFTLQSLVQIGTVVFEKIQFEFLYVHDLGPRSRNNLDLQYSHLFIYSIRCLLQLTFRSLAAIVSEKSTVSTFSFRKA